MPIDCGHESHDVPAPFATSNGSSRPIDVGVITQGHFQQTILNPASVRELANHTSWHFKVLGSKLRCKTYRRS